MAGSPTHGREGVLYLSTSTGSTAFGTEIGYSESWSWTPSKEQSEINRLNSSSKEFIEGLVSGTLSAGGSLISGSNQQRLLIGRFAKVLNDTGDTASDTAAVCITDGTMYFHAIAKPIDTQGTSDDKRGQKFVIPILASGLGIDVNATDIVKWTYDGTQNGDVLYVESTSTAQGIPKKQVCG
jgi:hypothetical protein